MNAMQFSDFLVAMPKRNQNLLTLLGCDLLDSINGMASHCCACGESSQVWGGLEVGGEESQRFL
jgi:hypothetical protein